MLRDSIKWCNKERIQAARIYELGKHEPPAITGLNMRNIMDGEQYLFDKYDKYDKLKQILDECEENWKNGQGPYKPEERPPRILISGAGLGGVVDKTIAVVEELGGTIVCYEGCSGIVSRRRLVDESEEPGSHSFDSREVLGCALCSYVTQSQTDGAGSRYHRRVEG